MPAVADAMFCPTCGVDTLPMPSGICAFCDTRLGAARPVGRNGLAAPSGVGRFLTGPSAGTTTPLTFTCPTCLIEADEPSCPICGANLMPKERA